ncbi:MAG: hypothetical protein E6J34_05435 [Chloroflexi bacterium]|nr:MAG: hypothetical protein E6J34_05435 [Chloroflexota bacterium]
MSFDFHLSPSKKRIYSRVAIALIVLSLLVVVGSVWSYLYYATNRPEAVSPTPVTLINNETLPSISTQLPTVPPTVTAVATTAAATTTTAATTTAVPTTTAAATPAAVPTVNSGPIAGAGGSLLFGTNFTLNDSSDQALNNPVGPLLKQMHVGIMRIPMRASLTQATYLQAAQLIKSIGAAPLVILETPEKVPSAISDDTQIIATMNQTFGSGIVYYEYGNEPNLGNGDPTWYVASWNKNVPAFRKLASNGRFVGPSLYTYAGPYLSIFLTGVKQNLPDMVSWHEYTCAAAWTADVCMQRLDNWAVHDADARRIMSGILGTTLPIMITEWNYTAEHSVAGDGKHDNPSFMTAWTTKALQSLAANNIYAAMQYSCTDAQIPLIDPSNKLTTQGSVFQQLG